MNKSISYAFICLGYNSPYAGNFIPSLLSISSKIGNEQFFYFFPKGAENRNWVHLIKDSGSHIIFIDNTSNKIAYRQICKYIKIFNIRLVHSHFTSLHVMSKLCLFNLDVKVVIHCHSNWDGGSHNFKNFIFYLKDMFLYNCLCCRSVKIAVSKELADRFNMIYVPNGISKSRAACYDKKEIDNIKKMLSIPSGINVLIMSWHPFIKGLDIAANAIGFANKENIKVNLLIVCGEDNLEDIKNYIDKKTKFNSNSSFFFYLKPIENIFDYHNICDIFLSASRSEGFPYGVLESLSIGNPTICSDIPGTNWAKEFGVLTFKSENYEELYKNIIKISLNLNFYKKNINKNSVLNKFSLESFSNKILTIYKKLLS